MKKLKNISLVIVVMFCYKVLGSSQEKVTASTQVSDNIEEEMDDINSLKWYFELEEDKKKEVSEFFNDIRECAKKNKVVQVINILAGNFYYNNFNDNSSHGLYFLDTMPANQLKRQILMTLGQIADLAKQGNIERIISFTNNVTSKKSDGYWIEHKQMPEIFTIERKNSLTSFFGRMKNHAGRGNIHDLFNISKSVEKDDLIKAYDLFTDMTSYEYLNYGNTKLYDLKASIMNLEDFGAGYRSFEIWRRHIGNLLSTLNLENKPLILELLSYARADDYNESNLWQNNVYFQPRIQRIVGEIFPAIRTDVPDGCLRCDGKEYNVNQYPYFVNKYLKTGRVPKVTIAEWDQQYTSQANNCGFFGYDEDDDTFKVPCVQSGTFLTNGSETGTFGWDQIVNITGNFNWTNGSQGHTEINDANVTGVFKAANFTRSKYPESCGYSTYYRGVDFDASRVVRTGDKVQPRNIQYPFFIVISDIYEEPIK